MLIQAAALLIGLVAGVIVVRSGWRGQRVGDHPSCRRCGFDLSGRSSGTNVCGECGANLTRRRAVAIGVREPRPGLTALGALILLPALGTLALVARKAAQEVNWVTHEPVS